MVEEQLVRDLPHMGIAELRRTCLAHGVSLEGCVEKSEVIERIRLHFGIPEVKMDPLREEKLQPDSSEVENKQETSAVRGDLPVDGADAKPPLVSMTTAKLKALERKVGVIGSKLTRAQQSGGTSAQVESLSPREASGRVRDTRVTMEDSENHKQARSPVVVLPHGGIYDISDSSSDSDSDASSDGIPSEGPNSGPPGLVSEDEASELGSTESPAGNDSYQSWQDSVRGADSGVHRPHALTSSESRFVLRMRMNAHLGSSPFLVPTEGIDGTW